MIEEYDYSITSKKVFNWTVTQLWRYGKLICAALFLIIMVYGFVQRRQIFSRIQRAAMASLIGGIFLHYDHVNLLMSIWLLSALAEILTWLFNWTRNDRAEFMAHSSISLGIQEDDTSEESRGEGSSTSDHAGHSNVCGDDLHWNMFSRPEGTTQDTSGGNHKGTGDTTEHCSTSWSRLIHISSSRSLETSDSSYMTIQNEDDDNKTLGTLSVGVAQQGASVGHDSPNRQNTKTITDNDVQIMEENIAQDSTNIDIHQQNRTNTSQHGGHCSTNREIRVQCSKLVFGMEPDWNEHPYLTGSKNVQKSTICDNQVQIRKSNDTTVQTSTQCDSQLQTEANEDAQAQIRTNAVCYGQTVTATGLRLCTHGNNSTQPDTCVDKVVQKHERSEYTGANKTLNVEVNTTDYTMNEQEEANMDKAVQNGKQDDSRVQKDLANKIIVLTQMDKDMHVETGDDTGVQASSEDGNCPQTESIDDSHEGQAKSRTNNDTRMKSSISEDGEVQTGRNKDTEIPIRIECERIDICGQERSNKNSSVHRGINVVNKVKMRTEDDNHGHLCIETTMEDSARDLTKSTGNRYEQANSSSNMDASSGMRADGELHTEAGRVKEIQDDTKHVREVQVDKNTVTISKMNATGNSNISMSTNSGKEIYRRPERQKQLGRSTDTIEHASTRGNREGQVGTSVEGREHSSVRSDDQKQAGESADGASQSSVRDDGQSETEACSDGIEKTRMQYSRQGQTRANKTIEQKGPNCMTDVAGTSSVTRRQMRSTGDSKTDTKSRRDTKEEAIYQTNDSQEQSGIISSDLETPQEDETTRTIPRQSGIIVNIGDNIGHVMSRAPSPGRHSRSSSPFEVLTRHFRRSRGICNDANGSGAVIDTRGLRGISQNASIEPGTSGEFSSIQVGVQFNTGGNSSQRRECGLMTLQGTPCKRRVSAGRCYLHRHSRQ